MNRCVDVLVGLQAGSEGKGKYISALSHVPYKALVRTGSVNAAHSVVYKGKTYVFHQIPAGALHFPNAKLILGANAQIDVEYLTREIERLKELNMFYDDAGNPRLVIDPNTTIIDPIDKIAENGGRMPDCGDLYFHPRDCDLHNVGDSLGKVAGTCMGCPKLPEDSAWAKLGSTTHGCGANTIRKTARGTKMVVLPGQELNLAKYFEFKIPDIKKMSYADAASAIMAIVEKAPVTDWSVAVDTVPVRYAEEDTFVKQFVGDTVGLLNRLIDSNQPIMLEGTQGSILSLHHGFKRKTTSRDTNAANWCSEAGVSPLAVRNVYGVMRTFPIRVAGNSGPMPGEEITWEEVTKHANSPVPIEEITSATKRKRRVSTLGEEHLRRALDLNRPTNLMLTFVDYLNHEDKNKASWDSLSQKTRDWITTLESKMGVFFNYLSTGPAPEHTIIRKSPGEMLAYVQNCPSDAC
jgi:adenylosuccinate synthase